jgi:Formate hydrogenlyase subunit 6/NADH:ubiquinone oxidoreductase 23 kD subunit (chain I)
MISKIKETAKKLLTSGDVQVVIGYGEGSNGRVRPLFVRSEAEVDRLVYDERCTQNIAMYVYKKESVALGKPALIANLQTLRGIIRLAAEKQVEEGSLIAVFVDDKNKKVSECRTFEEMEQAVAEAKPEIKPEDKEMIARLEAMSPAERWEFWQKELEHCIKCYACRQACPLCYCTQCTVEANQPQWITVPSTGLGNLEWHVMRAMHLAGRCITCGQCGEACPVGIPIHLLPIKLAEEVKSIYGSVSGLNREEGCAMSTYRPDDKENFIG